MRINQRFLEGCHRPQAHHSLRHIGSKMDWWKLVKEYRTSLNNVCPKIKFKH